MILDEGLSRLLFWGCLAASSSFFLFCFSFLHWGSPLSLRIDLQLISSTASRPRVRLRAYDKYVTDHCIFNDQWRLRHLPTPVPRFPQCTFTAIYSMGMGMGHSVPFSTQ
ncbi:hypothetical protein F5X98DRAFT_324766 [Xylaria grammica]|nr:hypothetical protein F5X98DRAFT_324766 [Xylaria grammica]